MIKDIVQGNKFIILSLLKAASYRNENNEFCPNKGVKLCYGENFKGKIGTPVQC